MMDTRNQQEILVVPWTKQGYVVVFLTLGVL